MATTHPASTRGPGRNPALLAIKWLLLIVVLAAVLAAPTLILSLV